jgi:hypothetical protein
MPKFLTLGCQTGGKQADWGRLATADSPPVLSGTVHSRHGLVEVRQVFLCGMEKEDGGSLGTQ